MRLRVVSVEVWLISPIISSIPQVRSKMSIAAELKPVPPTYIYIYCVWSINFGSTHVGFEQTLCLFEFFPPRAKSNFPCTLFQAELARASHKVKAANIRRELLPATSRSNSNSKHQEGIYRVRSACQSTSPEVLRGSSIYIAAKASITIQCKSDWLTSGEELSRVDPKIIESINVNKYTSIHFHHRLS